MFKGQKYFAYMTISFPKNFLHFSKMWKWANDHIDQSMFNSVKFVVCKRRYGLTGTALQNKYSELWCLLDWANPGCLGSSKHFIYEFRFVHFKRRTRGFKRLSVASMDVVVSDADPDLWVVIFCVDQDYNFEIFRLRFL